MELVEWLKSLPGVIKAEPCTVTIYEKQYVAAYVEQTRYDATTRRYFYVCGDPPKVYDRTSEICFMLPDDLREWYVSCYHNGVIRHGQTNSAPFGACFLLEEWQAPGRIDANLPKPYQRVFMAVV